MSSACPTLHPVFPPTYTHLSSRCIYRFPSFPLFIRVLPLRNKTSSLFDALEFLILVPLVPRRETEHEARLLLLFHTFKFPAYTNRRNNPLNAYHSGGKEAAEEIFLGEEVNGAFNEDGDTDQCLRPITSLKSSVHSMDSGSFTSPLRRCNWRQGICIWWSRSTRRQWRILDKAAIGTSRWHLQNGNPSRLLVPTSRRYRGNCP